MLRNCCAALLLMQASIAMAFEERTVDDFAPLASGTSIEEFDAEIRRYENDCLENSFSGSLGQRCFMKRLLWTRELQRIYPVFEAELPEKMRQAFIEEQQAWEDTLAQTELLAKYLIGKQFNEPGTMYITARAKALDDMMTTPIKQRVTMLREWQQNFLANQED
ncbi:MAG: lysozyme inhibitor LprI family protein [Halieaceae bacterium]